jgi:hypothetical protein
MSTKWEYFINTFVIKLLLIAFLAAGLFKLNTAMAPVTDIFGK